MPERFEVYSHETTKLMKAAFEEAWEKVKAREDDPEPSRKLASVRGKYLGAYVDRSTETAFEADAKKGFCERSRRHMKNPAPSLWPWEKALLLLSVCAFAPIVAHADGAHDRDAP